MRAFVDIIARQHGIEEIIASGTAERNEAFEYQVRRFFDVSAYTELILVDDYGRHPVISIDVRRLPGAIVFQTCTNQYEK